METLPLSKRTVTQLALLVALAAMALPVTSGPAKAQGIFSSITPESSQEAQPDSAAPEPQAIPASEIPLKAAEALARLQAIETQLSVDPDLTLIEYNLPNELAGVSREHERLGRIVLEHLSMRELWNLGVIWEAHEEKLSGWSDSYEDELREVTRVAQQSARIKTSWRLTAQTLRQDELASDALVAETDRVLDATAALETIVRDRLEHLLEVKSQVDDGLDGVRHVLGAIADARASVRGRILTRGVPPLWQVDVLRGEAASRSAARIWTEDRDAIAAYASDNLESILFSLILFVLLALLAIRLGHRIDDEHDQTDESLKGAAATLRRPVSAAVLLTILFSYAFWSRAPYVVLLIISVLAVVPLYRLLPSSGNPMVNRTIRVLLILFAVTGAVDLLVPPSVESRLVSLFTALAMSGVAAWLLRAADPEQMRQTGWGTVVWRGLQVSFVAGIVSSLANVFGWALLAETLTNGVLYSAYLGLAVVIAYRLIAGVIRLLPRTKLGQASHIMRDHGDLVTARAITALRIIASITWIWLALEAFEVIDPLGAWIGRGLTGPIKVGSIQFSIDRILSFAALILLAIWVARFLSFVLDVEVLPRLKLKRGVGNAISTVVQWAILGAGLLMAASALGLEGGQLAIVFGALSVGIGFGLQNIVSNFVSGLILIFEQPVKVGDKVEITSLALTGEVRRIGIRASVVRTFDGAEVIVPNSNLISSEVVNWTLSDQKRRVRVEVGVAYGTDPQRVIEVLKTAAREHPEVLKYPEAQVIFLEFGPSSLNFRLLFWTATFDDFFRVRSEMNVAVNEALEEAGITIPFPQRDLHVKGLPPGLSSV
jgi:small-conductance mechanosensitive channel